MTAEIAILNTKGIAIAADSAATIDLKMGEKKYFLPQKKYFAFLKNSLLV